jgi:hypothetical protein
MAVDQNAKLSAGMSLWQYKHGTVERLPSAGTSAAEAAASPQNRSLDERLTRAPPCDHEHEAAGRHEDRMNQAPWMTSVSHESGAMDSRDRA